jgi:hypothetical protein
MPKIGAPAGPRRVSFTAWPRRDAAQRPGVRFVRPVPRLRDPGGHGVGRGHATCTDRQSSLRLAAHLFRRELFYLRKAAQAANCNLWIRLLHVPNNRVLLQAEQFHGTVQLTNTSVPIRSKNEISKRRPSSRVRAVGSGRRTVSCARVVRVCRGAGHQASPLSTGRLHDLPRFSLDGGSVRGEERIESERRSGRSEAAEAKRQKRSGRSEAAEAKRQKRSGRSEAAEAKRQKRQKRSGRSEAAEVAEAKRQKRQKRSGRIESIGAGEAGEASKSGRAKRAKRVNRGESGRSGRSSLDQIESDRESHSYFGFQDRLLAMNRSQAPWSTKRST